jgi:hypothetical protein
MKKGRAATMTHDYKRNGTTTLFAALNVLDGQVIAQCQKRHRHIEWLKFLRQIERETPQGKPFTWTKSARDIVQKVIRANGRLVSKQNATLGGIHIPE